MSNTEIINQILGDTSIPSSDYPRVKWTSVDGNAFSIIATASKAWRSKDRGVSSRIGSVLMSNADSYETLLGVCVQLCPMQRTRDEDEEEEEYEDGDEG
jgi:hypothetical protein